MPEFLLQFILTLCSVITTSIASYFLWGFKRQKERAEGVATMAKETAQDVHRIKEKLEDLETKHGGLGNSFVTEPRVKEIVDERMEEVKTELKKLPDQFASKLAPLQEALTEILIQQAEQAGYRKALQDAARQRTGD